MSEYKVSREDSMKWLVSEFGSKNWPQSMDEFATGRIIGNWRFVDTLPSREIMFCNMIDRGIQRCEIEDIEILLFSDAVIH